MKKIYLLLLFICSSVFAFADGLTATLQHGETMTAFFGPEALNSAYSAAADGDIITLSAGQFTGVSSISKSVRIIGAYGFTSTAENTTYISTAMEIGANNVKLEGMYFKADITIGAVTNTIIRRCYINNLKQSGAHTHTLIDQCVLIDDAAVKTGVNYAIKNTTIDHFSEMNTASNMTNITNCYVNRYYSAVSSASYVRPYAVYKNNVLRTFNNSATVKVILAAPSEFYYNCFYVTKVATSNGYAAYIFDSGCAIAGNTEYSMASGSSDFAITGPITSHFSQNGQDGTRVGIQGGEGWVAYPGIPRVTEAKIDAQTDDKGKLNAEITVTAQK